MGFTNVKSRHLSTGMTMSIIGMATVGSMVAAALPAVATSSHGVVGTVLNNQEYFTSLEVRIVHGSTISIQLDQLPSRNIFWIVFSTTNQQDFGGGSEIRDNNTYELANNVINGTQFQNKYGQGYGSCLFRCNYNTSGTEYY